MARKPNHLTDLSKLDENLADGTTLTISESLRIIVTKGEKRFQARYRKNGYDTTGPAGIYPDTSVEHALTTATLFVQKMDAKVAASGKAEKKQKTRERSNHHSQSDDDSRSTIKSERELFNITRAIWHNTGIDLEYRIALLLMLAIPASPQELLDIKWTNILGVHLILDKTPKKPKPNERNYSQKLFNRYAVLSSAVLEWIEQLKPYTKGQEYIFPKLHAMDNEERTRVLNDHLKDVEYPRGVKISSLQHVFTYLATEYTEFRNEFIERVRTKKYKETERHQAFHDFLVRSLIEWWGLNIMRLLKMDRYISLRENDFGKIDFEIKLTKFTPPPI